MTNDKSTNRHSITPAEAASVRSLGNWINQGAYFAAESESEVPSREARKKLPEVEQNRLSLKIRKAKAKYLTQCESYIMSAKSSADMMHRVIRSFSMMREQDAPQEAQLFLDSVVTEQIEFKTAQQLLISYMRIRASNTQSEPEGGQTAVQDINDDDLGEN